MFTVKDRKLQIKATDLMIRSFLEAYAQDKTEEKEEANKLFWYVHIASQMDPEAPFYRASKYEIKQLAKNEAYRDPDYKWKGSIYNPAQADALLEEYVNAYSTPESRMLKSYDEKIDEYQVMLKNHKPTIKENINDKTGAVTFTSNHKILADALLAMEKLVIARDNLVAKLKHEGEKGTVRGQQEPSFLEKMHDG